MSTLIKDWCRWQWPRCLRRELSSPAHTGVVGSGLTWDIDICVRLFSVHAVVCQVVALRWADSPSKESYGFYMKFRELKNGKGPTKGCRAIYRQLKIILRDFSLHSFFYMDMHVCIYVRVSVLKMTFEAFDGWSPILISKSCRCRLSRHCIFKFLYR
jgi:hypothetical protein